MEAVFSNPGFLLWLVGMAVAVALGVVLNAAHVQNLKRADEQRDREAPKDPQGAIHI